ncbi:MAG: hypothetical protein EU529_05910 [Promethearchaeota archaeon]|nr:MAG: hypothetical protein EU529_05910 [Candidatus Lokiarchaeota archaeon]
MEKTEISEQWMCFSLKKCKCKEWQKLVDYMLIVDYLAKENGVKFMGEGMKFCPYCGKKLGGL